MNFLRRGGKSSPSTPSSFSLGDLCDRCGVRPSVRVRTRSGGELLFCGHHFQENEVALIIDGASVQDDERDRINVKPSPSASR